TLSVACVGVVEVAASGVTNGRCPGFAATYIRDHAVTRQSRGTFALRMPPHAVGHQKQPECRIGIVSVLVDLALEAWVRSVSELDHGGSDESLRKHAAERDACHDPTCLAVHEAFAGTGLSRRV